MVTWTFDLTALIVGVILGAFLMGTIFLIVYLRDGGAWDIGFSEGFKARSFVEKMKESKKKEE